jgi:hypothetical protein
VADAQRALARQYGFASWPALKAHVESRPAGEAPVAPSAAAGGSRTGGGGAGGAGGGPPDDGGEQPRLLFHRFTEQARRVLFFARYEASQLGSASIEAEHLLLAFVRDGTGVTSRLFAESHLAPDRIRTEVASRVVGREALSSSVTIPFSPEAKQILLWSVQEADRLQHGHVGAEHMVLGILRQERSLAASILVDLGLRLEAARRHVARLPNEEPA